MYVTIDLPLEIYRWHEVDFWYTDAQIYLNQNVVCIFIPSMVLTNVKKTIYGTNASPYGIKKFNRHVALKAVNKKSTPLSCCIFSYLPNGRFMKALH
jgi:hypothetical protein